MTDKFSPAKRKTIMQAIRGKDTKPEKVVRSLVFSLGFRFRLHDSSLPGKPDLVFKTAKKVIFVHGCYWHRHNCQKGRSLPAINQTFWQQKFEANRKRDQRVRKDLRKAGWNVLVIWECQTKTTQRNRLLKILIRYLTHA
jgi:DNA mismatch endonuclease (patch repair protein)